METCIGNLFVNSNLTSINCFKVENKLNDDHSLFLDLFTIRANRKRDIYDTFLNYKKIKEQAKKLLWELIGKIQLKSKSKTKKR